MSDKKITSKITIKIEQSDGTNSELITFAPYPVASGLICDAIEWKERWNTNFKEAEEWLKLIDEHVAKNKTKQ